MKIIHKKILPKYMDAVIKGEKTFELRKDEDDIQVGDIIKLHEWEDGKYKNVTVDAEVMYVLRDCPECGLMDGYCIIGIACNANMIYQKGREDEYKEITSEYMLLTEEQVKDIRTNAIDEYFNELYKASEIARPVGWLNAKDIVTIQRARDIADQMMEGKNE